MGISCSFVVMHKRNAGALVNFTEISLKKGMTNPEKCGIIVGNHIYPPAAAGCVPLWGESHMANRNQHRNRGGKAQYILLLVIACCVLVFAIGLIVRKQDETATDPQSTDLSANSTIATLPAETIPMSTVPAATVSEIPTETITEPTEPQIPEETGSGNTVASGAKHIYIRVNHEKTVELPEGFGTDAVYSIDNENAAVIDENGLLTGLEKGSCTLTVTSSAQSVEIPVTVREMVTEDDCTYVDGILVANKSYSLPESYDPGLLPVTEEAFERLSKDAKAQGLDIHNSSDYRTYAFQVECYNSMVEGYSKEYADSVSARPGHSEHQTGYTIDCNTIDNTFADTPEGKWLAQHCWEYGFIIRYPEDKVDLTGYAYESWHIRYVGVEHAKEIWEQGICLEEYLDIDSKYDEQ